MSANATTAAPTGRKKLAQAKERSDTALGHGPQNTSSPESAKESDWRNPRSSASIRGSNSAFPVRRSLWAKADAFPISAFGLVILAFQLFSMSAF
jgi:hypothetical protein